MSTEQNQNTVDNTNEKEHGRLYWMVRHAAHQVKSLLKRHRVTFLLILLAGMVVLFLFRAYVHPYVIAVRTRIFLVAVGVPLVFLFKKLMFSGRWWRRIVAAALIASFLGTVWQWGDEIHEYFALYYQYGVIKKIELKELPLTGFERIQPLHSVHSIAYEATARSEVRPMIPNFVRIGKNFEWTIGIEPDHVSSRMTQRVRSILHDSATNANVNFLDPKSHARVSFPAGENLLWGRNVFNAVIKTFLSPWQYVNYEPKRVIYITDDRGEWVQIICLIRWRGIFFPRPEFGGVYVIRQEQEDALSTLHLLFWGIGEWIPPQNIEHYSFLKGQNLAPYEVTRYIASSFRFREGFMGPFPWIHRGDIRIPDLEHDTNPQPFTAYFHIQERQGMLYHYFGLEPYGHEKQATTVSLFIPADNPSAVYVYPHDKLNNLITGVSTIPAKVIGSQKIYTWDKNWPVEQRPFIRKIGGKTRFCWLTTIITRKEGEGEKQFIAGAIPDVVITDGESNIPVWVNPLLPDTWEDEINKHIIAARQIH